MNKKVFNLKNVGEQEAQDVRDLLRANNINFYETFENAWRTSTPALWLCDESDYKKAREIIDVYQQQRVQMLREQQSQSGRRSLWGDFVYQPLKFLLFLAATIAIIYFSVRPFYGFS